MSSRIAIMLLLLSTMLFSCGRKAPVAKRHYPVQNPQGIDFDADPEFVKSYNQYLVNRLRKQSQGIASSMQAMRVQDLHDIDSLKSLDPKGAGWDVDYIPPPKTKADEALDYVKGKTVSGIKSIKDKITKTPAKPAAQTAQNQKADNKEKKSAAKKKIVVGKPKAEMTEKKSAVNNKKVSTAVDTMKKSDLKGKLVTFKKETDKKLLGLIHGKDRKKIAVKEEKTIDKELDQELTNLTSDISGKNKKKTAILSRTSPMRLKIVDIFKGEKRQ